MVLNYKNIIVIIFLIFIDQLSKFIISTGWNFQSKIISINYVTNTGAAFSILTGWNVLLILIATIVLATIFYFREEIPTVPFILICAGIVGNLIDRIVLGHVIDFIDLGWWPIFNIADSMICIGAIIIIVEELRNKNNNKRKKTKSYKSHKRKN